MYKYHINQKVMHREIDGLRGIIVGKSGNDEYPSYEVAWTSDSIDGVYTEPERVIRSTRGRKTKSEENPVTLFTNSLRS